MSLSTAEGSGVGRRVDTGHFRQQRLSPAPTPPIMSLGTVRNDSHSHSNEDSTEHHCVLGTVPRAQPRALTCQPPTPAEADPTGPTLYRGTRRSELARNAGPRRPWPPATEKYDARSAGSWEPVWGPMARGRSSGGPGPFDPPRTRQAHGPRPGSPSPAFGDHASSPGPGPEPRPQVLSECLWLSGRERVSAGVLPVGTEDPARIGSQSNGDRG